jgi:hypothetical protein
MATSTAKLPESLKKTCCRLLRSVNWCANRLADLWVRPPNLTCYWRITALLKNGMIIPLHGGPPTGHAVKQPSLGSIAIVCFDVPSVCGPWWPARPNTDATRADDSFATSWLSGSTVSLPFSSLPLSLSPNSFAVYPHCTVEGRVNMHLWVGLCFLRYRSDYLVQ